MTLQPQFCCETNYEVFQSDLPHAIKISSRFPSNHPQKAERLDWVDHLIMRGADPMRVMDLQGEEATPMQRALEYGDHQTINAIKEAMGRFSKSPPLVITLDPDAFREEDLLKKLPVAILFPGQGSQYVKMLSEAKDLDPCKLLIEKANEVLGYDILDICLNGPEDKLEQTKYCQPAMFLANCCALEKLRMEQPDKVERCQATAGLSLGEYNALWLSGVMSFEDAIRIVRTRADAMHDESKKSAQAMISVAGLDHTVLERLCVESAKRAGQTPDGKDEVCVIANHLFPKGYTCSGTKQAVLYLKEAAEMEGCLQARLLKTSGAFHTSMMEPAGLRLNKALRASVQTMAFPKMDVYMNVSGMYQRAGTDPREINMDLVAQVSNPVLWQQSVEEMIKQGITEFYECGPMKQLKAMMKRINQDAWEKTHSVSV